MPSRKPSNLSLIAAFAMACLLVSLQYIVPTVSRSRQLRTSAEMKTYRAILDAYRSLRLRFPETLQIAVREVGVTGGGETSLLKAEDAWGHPLLYETRGSGSAYILVSYGHDGRPDGSDYWWLRSAFGERGYAPEACPTFDADIIASDLAFHRPCGR